MKVIFTTTTKSKLATLPITNGQIIALSDAVGYYYDMGGVRYPASSTQVLDALPGNGIVDMLYIVNNSVYTWDGTNYVKLISSVEIDDANASTATAYSSSKTEELISGIISDSSASTATAYSSSKTEEQIATLLDDSSASTATAYSSTKTEEVAEAAALALLDDANASTATTYSSTKIDTLIEGVTSFEIEIVQVLPTEDIDTHKIYFLEKSTPGQANVYEEYMYIENTWELIGTTEVTISLATTATAGIVKPDGITISVAADGTITAIGGGGSSGHTIMDDAGSTVSAEDNLQFKGAYVEDDSQNDKTVVNVVREMQYSQVASLTDAQKKGIIITEKDVRPTGVVITASSTGYSNTTSGLASTTVQGAIDELADGAGGGGGHVIENQSGSTMTQRSNLQFLDATPIDSGATDATQVEVVKVITKSQLDSAPDGIYRISDEDDSSLSTNAANVTYNNTTSGLTATDVQTAIDEVDSSLDTLASNVFTNKWTASVNASIGATSVTITDVAITTSSNCVIEDYAETASGKKISVTQVTVTAGQAVLQFSALEEAASFRLHITTL